MSSGFTDWINKKDPPPPAGFAAGKPGSSTGGGGGSFGDWLGGLPSNATLAPKPGPSGVRGVPAWMGQNKVPAMWKAFAPYGKSLIDKSALAKMRGTTAGIAGGRREFERGLLSAYRNAGVNSLFAKRGLAESRPMVGSQIAQARGGIEAERQDETFNLMAAIQGAIGESYLGERDLWLQLNQASLGRKAGRDGAKSAMWSSAIGAGGAIIGGALAGPVGAALGGSLGGGGGGGGASSGAYPYKTL